MMELCKTCAEAVGGCDNPEQCPIFQTVSKLEQDKADLIEEGLANEATIARLREELARWKADHWSNKTSSPTDRSEGE